jgi:hypothetical protein
MHLPQYLPTYFLNWAGDVRERLAFFFERFLSDTRHFDDDATDRVVGFHIHLKRSENLLDGQIVIEGGGIGANFDHLMRELGPFQIEKDQGAPVFDYLFESFHPLHFTTLRLSAVLVSFFGRRIGPFVLNSGSKVHFERAAALSLFLSPRDDGKELLGLLAKNRQAKLAFLPKKEIGTKRLID